MTKTIISNDDALLLHQLGEASELAEMLEKSAAEKHQAATQLHDQLLTNFETLVNGTHRVQDTKKQDWIITVEDRTVIDISKLKDYDNELDYGAGI